MPASSDEHDEGRTSRIKGSAIDAICRDVFVLVLQIQTRQLELPDAPALKRQLTALFDAIETDARKIGLAHGDLEDIRYALAAFVDETIHYSDWPQKKVWAQMPLQAELFAQSRAGTVFFERLEELRRRDSPGLRVYYTCLALGFSGEYRFESEHKLDRIKLDLAKAVVRKHKRLSINATRPDESGLGRRGISLLAIGVSGLLLSSVIVFILWGILTWTTGNTIDLLGEMTRR